MIRLLPRVAAVVPGVTYWIAGGGSRSERQHLERLAASIGVSDRVRFLGVAEPYLELWPRAAIHLSLCGKWRSYEL